VSSQNNTDLVADIKACPRVCQILLDKSCVLPTFKNICQVKKSSSPTVWHNSIASGIMRQTKFCLCPSTSWKLTLGILLYCLFLFAPSHLQGNADGNHDPRAHIYVRRGEFCQVSIFFQVGLPNYWRPIFLVLPKLDGCQVGLSNCWSCS
jgi:hypothetical protein